jgi:hypothetical protein
MIFFIVHNYNQIETKQKHFQLHVTVIKVEKSKINGTREIASIQLPNYNSLLPPPNLMF